MSQPHDSLERDIAKAMMLSEEQIERLGINAQRSLTPHKPATITEQRVAFENDVKKAMFPDPPRGYEKSAPSVPRATGSTLKSHSVELADLSPRDRLRLAVAAGKTGSSVRQVLSDLVTAYIDRTTNPRS